MQQLMGILQLNLAGRPEFRMPEKRRARHHENGRVDEKREIEGNDRIDEVVAAGLPKALLRRGNSPGLN